MWSGDGSSPTMVLVRQWWSDSHGSDVVWWSPSVLCSLFSLRGSESGFLVWSVDRSSRERRLFVGLIVRGSSSAGFHSFDRRFLSLSSLRWSLPPCWIQWRRFVLLFLLSYSVFSLILLFVWFPRKWRERKIKIGNWDINVLIFGFNYNGVRSIFVLFHIQSFLESLFTCRENGGKENIKLETEILMVFFLG